MPTPPAAGGGVLRLQLCQGAPCRKGCCKRKWGKVGQTETEFHSSFRFELGQQVLREAFPDFLDHAVSLARTVAVAIMWCLHFPSSSRAVALQGRDCVCLVPCRTARDVRSGVPLHAQHIWTLGPASRLCGAFAPAFQGHYMPQGSCYVFWYIWVSGPDWDFLFCVCGKQFLHFFI